MWCDVCKRVVQRIPRAYGISLGPVTLRKDFLSIDEVIKRLPVPLSPAAIKPEDFSVSVGLVGGLNPLLGPQCSSWRRCGPAS